MPPLVKGAIEVGTLQDFLESIAPHEAVAPRPPAAAPPEPAPEPELILGEPDEPAEQAAELILEEAPATGTHELTLAEGDAVIDDELDAQTVVSRNPSR